MKKTFKIYDKSKNKTLVLHRYLTVRMDVFIIFKQIRFIISEPNEAWEMIRNESENYRKAFFKFAFPLILLGAMTSMIGNSFRYPLYISFIWGVIFSIIPFLGIMISAIFIVETARFFQYNKNLSNSYKLIIYSSTPPMVAAIFANLHPNLFFINYFGIYSVYLIWTGCEPLLQIGNKNKVSFVIMASFIMFAVKIFLLIAFMLIIFPILVMIK
jgi:hypothetical protein